NAAFYYGLVHVLRMEERPVWSQMSFSAAEENFHAGARVGIDAQLYWPGVGQAPATELVLRRLLPLAHEGLEDLGIEASDRDRLVVESELLADNPLGDPARRPLYVYNSPGADGSDGVPAVYVIQGFTGQIDMWLARSAFEPTVVERLDAMFAAGDCPAAIVVF